MLWQEGFFILPSERDFPIFPRTIYWPCLAAIVSCMPLSEVAAFAAGVLEWVARQVPPPQQHQIRAETILVFHLLQIVEEYEGPAPDAQSEYFCIVIANEDDLEICISFLDQGSTFHHRKQNFKFFASSFAAVRTREL